MYEEKITVHFVINSRSTNQKEACPLHFRTTLFKERKQFSTE